MKTMKKLFAVMFALCMLITLPSMTYAASNITGEGTGTNEDPYVISYRGAALEGEVVPAGGDVVYYAFAEALAGYTMEIKTTDNIAVQYGRQTLYPENGSIMIYVDPYIAGQGGSIGIWNMGDADATFSIDLFEEQTEQEKGTWDNPEDITDAMYGEKEVAENSDGYYVTYTAPATGTIRIDVNAFDADYNYIGWTYTVNGIYYVDGVEKYYYGDAIDNTMDYDAQTTVIEVNAGDTFTIAAGTYEVETVTENGLTYEKTSRPAGLITINISFEYPKGTENNPNSITDLESEVSVPAGGAWFSTIHSGVTLKIEGDVSVVYNGETYTAVDGVVTIEGIEAGFFEPAKLQILNAGTEAAACKISVIYPEGHANNPKDVVEGEASITLEDENYDGYFYDFTITEDGKLTITASGDTWGFVVDIHKDGLDEWGNPLIVYGDQITTYSENGTFTADVVAGDVVVIRVFNYTEEEVRIPMGDGQEDFVYMETAAPAGTVTINVDLATASDIIPEEGDFPSTMILVLLGAALVSAGFVAKKRFA